MKDMDITKDNTIKEEKDKKILSSLKNIFTEYGYDPKEEALLKIINAFNSNYVLQSERKAEV